MTSTVFISVLLTVFVGVLGFMFKRLYDKLDELDSTLDNLNVIIGKMEEHEKYIELRLKEMDRRINNLEAA